MQLEGSIITVADTVAGAFVQARREARSLQSYPGTAPQNLADAYAIQNRAIALDGRTVVGWKVGRINAPADAQLGANRLAGPVFADAVMDAEAGDGPFMPVFEGGFGAAEAEFLLYVAPGFAGPLPQNDEQTKAIVADVRIGIEVASSPYPGINADGPPVTVSDFGNNAGLVRGPSVDGWRDMDLCGVQVTTLIDNAVVGEATAATMLDGPYGAVRFLLANLAERGIDTSRGLWVSTGAVTGVHEATVGQRIVARFEGLGEVRCVIAAATPR